MKIKQIHILLFTILLMIPVWCNARNFKVLDTSNNLSNNTVKCITQDKNGFMWFGTFDGLCRFDGVRFTVFRHDPNDVSSLSKNQITCLQPTNDGIFVGSEYGLFFFSFTDQCFYDCVQQNGSQQEKPITGYVHTIFSQDGQLYALADHFLQLSNQRTFKQCNISAEDKWSYIIPYKKSYILAHNGSELVLIHTKTRKIISRIDNKIAHEADVMFYDSNKNLIYVGYGLNHSTLAFQIQDNRLQTASATVPANVKSMVSYNQGILFGTDGQGLVYQRNETKEIYIPENSNISSDAIYSLYVDNDNTLWVGTHRGGINYSNSPNEWFTTYGMEKKQLTHNFVTAIYEAPTGTTYIGLDGGGLNVCNFNTRQTVAYTTENSRITGNNVLSLAGDKRYIWLGIFGGKLNRFDILTHSFRSYDIPTAEENQIWVIKSDEKGYLWIGGKEGVYCFDKEKEVFTLEKNNIQYTSEIAFDGDYIWVSSSFYGLYKLDRSGNILKHYQQKSDKMAIPNNIVRYVFIDSQHQVWFSSAYSGLSKLDEINETVTIYGKENGLSNPNVVSIGEDKNGHLWLGTYDGLFRFNQQTERFIRFGKEYNLSSTQFNFNAFYQESEVMYFGTTKGLVAFRPSEIKYEEKFKPVFFTDFQLYNGEVKMEDTYRIHPSEVKLPYDKTFFTIHFSVAELISPEKIQFSYYLKNFDKGWQQAQQERKASYTNVSPGEYEFCVRATNSLGEWNDEYSSFRIIITPPWWKSFPAIILWILLFLGVLALLFWLYQHELNNKHILQLKEIEKNTLKNINEAKLSFFTNITHELRTPIFLITAPLEELISSDKTSVYIPKAYLSAMYRNCMRLNKLISRIIDFRKLEAGKLVLELKSSNVVTFCKSIATDFEAICEQKGVALLFMPSTLDIHLTFDHEKLETILVNLIGNAMKYTPEGGRIILHIDETDSAVLFAVEDNGIGIKKEHHESIFNRFFQVDSNSCVSGDGIGLAFVKHLVELHEGIISVESELQMGSTFKFSIPKKKIENQLHLSPLITDKESERQIKVPITAAIHNPTAPSIILVIDDEKEAVEMLDRSLSDSYKIIKAYNGVDGLALAKETCPDLIICDIMMPKMNGLEFLTALRNNNTIVQTPVIMFTAKTAEDDMLAAFEHGADAYLTKPISMRYLRKRIEHLLSQSESMHISSFVTDSKTNYSKEEKKFLFKCKLVIDENLTNTDFDVMLFAGKLGMSHSSLYKKIKGLTGKSVIEFINEYRIYKAVQCFMEGKTNINIVCAECGFNDAKNFREIFKKKMNVTPKQYIQNM